MLWGNERRKNPNISHHWKLCRLKDKIIFSSEFKWIKSSNGEKVTGAIQGGCKHGEMYIGRAFHVADLIPGKFSCSHDVLIN